MSDWFTRWFGKEYLELYPHRDEADAREAVAMIRSATSAPPDRILDLACGSGRHSRILREWAWTVGFDLSETLLGVARADDPVAPYVRGDMRVLPFEHGAFGMVVNLFTSFGYFDTDVQHAAVIAEVARVTRRGGTFVLDYLNAEEVRRTLVPFDERLVHGRRVQQRRAVSADGRYVEKTISAEHCDHTYSERVRLFSAEELIALLEGGGFVVRQEYGDYDATPRSAVSPRVILFAERV